MYNVGLVKTFQVSQFNYGIYSAIHRYGLTCIFIICYIHVVLALLLIGSKLEAYIYSHSIHSHVYSTPSAVKELLKTNLIFLYDSWAFYIMFLNSITATESVYIYK